MELKYSKPYAIFMEITPEIAAEFLAHNTPKNRPLHQQKVRAYTRDMSQGAFSMNGETIKFNVNGELIDGQHRCAASVTSGSTFKSLVVFGLQDDATNIDRGTPRTSSQAMRMAGYESDAANNNNIATIKMHFLLVHKNKNVTDTEIMKYYDEHGEMVSCATRHSRKGTSDSLCRKAGCQTAAYHALLCGVPAETIERFFEVANTGFCADATESAAIVTRNFILTGWKKEHGSTGGAVRRAIYVITANAIYDFHNKVQRKLKYSTDKEPEYLKRVKVFENGGKTND